MNWWIRFLSYLGIKYHTDYDDELFDTDIKRKKIAIKCMNCIRILIFVMILLAIGVWLFGILVPRKPLVIKKNVMIDIEKDAKLQYPYESLSSLISQSKKCINHTRYQDWEEQTAVTVKNTEDVWIMIQLKSLFEFLQQIVEREKEHDISTFCSTMLGMEDLPCACVVRLSKNRILWIVRAHERNARSFLSSKSTPTAIIREKNYLFQSRDELLVKKQFPKVMDIEYVECQSKRNSSGLHCQTKQETFQGTDVFWMASRMMYYLMMDPQKYTIGHPDFGTFEPIENTNLV